MIFSIQFSRVFLPRVFGDCLNHYLIVIFLFIYIFFFNLSGGDGIAPVHTPPHSTHVQDLLAIANAAFESIRVYAPLHTFAFKYSNGKKTHETIRWWARSQDLSNVSRHQRRLSISIYFPCVHGAVRQRVSRWWLWHEYSAPETLMQERNESVRE